ncbi:hypothetical protein K474DRAFT_100748 [Panus rudis PR-1116 ss-1]|nr:hypothetical protein K474DRAFT_100748 [Panus rudis PR-1116 ss-1]
MQSTPIRVIVRLPYNRPEDSLPDPPRVEWNSEKEQILWEVIAKSRAVEGAGTDWKGLAAHLQVPLPYLLYRAQTRYEEDLRGLQGIQGTLSPEITSPLTQGPPTFATGGSRRPSSALGGGGGGEYFPRLPTGGERPSLLRRDSLRTEGIRSGDLRASIVSPGGRPLNVRARLSSLGSVQAARSRKLSTISNTPGKKVLSSSTLTLQGPKRSKEPIRPLSPTASQPSPSGSSSPGASSEGEDDDLADEETRRAEEQDLLEQKLKELQRVMTRDTLGLVASPARARKDKGKSRDDRGRPQTLSSSSSSGPHRRPQLDMTDRYKSQTPSHHSLSSVDANSPQGSIPSIPSPPPESAAKQGRQTPLRPLSQPSKSTSPPAVSPSRAWGTSAPAKPSFGGTTGVTRTKIGGGRMSSKGSEMGSEASSFSDLSGGYPSVRYCCIRNCLTWFSRC